MRFFDSCTFFNDWGATLSSLCSTNVKILSLATLEHGVHTLLLVLITILYSSTGMRGANTVILSSMRSTLYAPHT